MGKLDKLCTKERVPEIRVDATEEETTSSEMHLIVKSGCASLSFTMKVLCRSDKLNHTL
jgi:hypothetical protein